MKIKVSKNELHECVRNAVTRIVNESKENFFDKPSKHEKAKKDKFAKKSKKGNKGNQRWDYTNDDEDMY